MGWQYARRRTNAVPGLDHHAVVRLTCCSLLLLVLEFSLFSFHPRSFLLVAEWTWKTRAMIARLPFARQPRRKGVDTGRVMGLYPDRLYNEFKPTGESEKKKKEKKNKNKNTTRDLFFLCLVTQVFHAVLMSCF